MALVQGWDRTRLALAGWNRDPGPALGRWAAGGLTVALVLLVGVWAVASVSTPDPSPLARGATRSGTWSDVASVLWRNSLVLALHAMACVAGFIAGSSLPLVAQEKRGAWRVIHDRAGPLAIAFVAGATLFSLSTQAYVLGASASTVAAHLHISPARLLVALAPHALLELTALFLPLAAWIMASRRGRWDELLAATLVTVGLAVPALVVAALLEVYVSPHLVAFVRG